MTLKRFKILFSRSLISEKELSLIELGKEELYAQTVLHEQKTPYLAMVSIEQ